MCCLCSSMSKQSNKSGDKMSKIVCNEEEKVRVYQIDSEEALRLQVRNLEIEHELISINNGDYMVRKK